MKIIEIYILPRAKFYSLSTRPLRQYLRSSHRHILLYLCDPAVCKQHKTRCISVGLNEHFVTVDIVPLGGTNSNA